MTYCLKKISDLFYIMNGKGITREEIALHPGDFPAVQSAEANNGVMGYIDYDYCKEAGYTYTRRKCLTVARSGSAGYVTYQANGCCVGDSAKILLPKNETITENALLYIRTVLMHGRYRYTYARKVTEDLYAEDTLQTPIDDLGNVDYAYMDSYISNLDISADSTPDYFLDEGYEKACWYMDVIDRDAFEDEYSGALEDTSLTLDTKNWKPFYMSDLFEIRKGKRLTKDDQLPGDTIYIGATASNNGISNFIGQEPIHDGNTISVTYNGSIGEAFYQKHPYWATDDVNVLYAKDFSMNPYIALFICTILRHEKEMWSYARKWNLDQMKQTIIKLPTDDSGSPDYKFMEDYIKGCAFSCNIE